MTSAQLATTSRWVEDGAEFLRAELYGTPARFATVWAPDDILIVQGDAHLQLDEHGFIKESVPDIASCA
ncbi:MAG TPA: hypothetical protein VE570_01765 [Thermoleophilaceae bacterium]|jgi:hypothetical protein|nr:hypothetical protein [Thermoleophilaceae bacterium]